MNRPESASSVLKRSPGKLYEQVAMLIEKRIDSGDWMPGERLPSIEALSESFDVAIITVRRALKELEQKGLISRHQGQGTFVAQNATTKQWLKLESNWDELIQMWGRSKPRALKVEKAVGMPSLRPEDGIPAPGYRHMRRVHFSDDLPYAISDLHVDRRLYGQSPRRFETEMVIVVLDSLCDVKSMRQSLTIETADLETASLLKISVGAPVGIMRRVVTDKANTVIYVGEAIYRGDLVKMERELKKTVRAD